MGAGLAAERADPVDGGLFHPAGSRNTLYRRVLARYVQMATEEGTTQAMFPEGGLSLDGRVGEAKLGLLSYIVEGWQPDHRDVVFVPVGLAYDRVLEDRVLVEAAASGTRRFRNRPLWVAGHALRFLWARWRGRSAGFGTAAAGFGAPVSLRDHLAAGGKVEALGEVLMARIAAVCRCCRCPWWRRRWVRGPRAATRCWRGWRRWPNGWPRRGRC